MIKRTKCALVFGAMICIPHHCDATSFGSELAAKVGGNPATWAPKIATDGALIFNTAQSDSMTIAPATYSAALSRATPLSTMAKAASSASAVKNISKRTISMIKKTGTVGGQRIKYSGSSPRTTIAKH